MKNSLQNLVPVILTALFAISIEAVAAEAKVKIGVSTPMTGESATFGLDVKDIITFANSKFTADRYELVFEDDKCSPKEAVTAAQKFISLGVKYVIGLPCSATAVPSGPFYERAGILTMVTWASSPKISTLGNWIFRTVPNDSVAARTLLTHVRKKHKRIAVLSGLTDYSQDFKEVLFEANSGNEVTLFNEDYLPDVRDFRSIVLKLRQLAPDAIILNSHNEPSFGVIVKTMAELKWKIPIFGAYWPSSPVLLDDKGLSMDGVEFVDTPALESILTVEGKGTFKEYLEKFGKLRSSESSFAPTIEGFRALDRAIRGGGDPRKILSSETFQGIYGSYTFDKNGDSQGIPFVIRRVTGNTVETLGE